MKYFRPHEFECRCKYGCGKGFTQMNPDFLEQLDYARLLSDTAYSLSSAIRCHAHNRDEDGRENSAHLVGLAVDIRTPTSESRFKVLYGLIKAGFVRIGVYEEFVHVDDDRTKPQKVSWFIS